MINAIPVPDCVYEAICPRKLESSDDDGDAAGDDVDETNERQRERMRRSNEVKEEGQDVATKDRDEEEAQETWSQVGPVLCRTVYRERLA